MTQATADPLSVAAKIKQLLAAVDLGELTLDELLVQRLKFVSEALIQVACRKPPKRRAS